MKVDVYDIEGKSVGKIELPAVFEYEIRKDLIKRAVLSEESKELQPKGSYRWAGLETSAHYRGRKESFGSLKNRGQAMLPREFYGNGVWGRVRRIPSAVGGRRAHPPKPWKKLVEEINKKEWLKALKSAIAATADKVLVKERHKVKIDSPIVVEDKFEELKKTKEVNKFLEKVIEEDLKRAKEGKKRKTGVRRKRKSQIVKYPKSALIITVKKMKAAENIPGIDSTTVDELKVKDLAPGAKPGRFLIITKSALKKLEEKIKEERGKNE